MAASKRLESRKCELSNPHSWDIHKNSKLAYSAPRMHCVHTTFPPPPAGAGREDQGEEIQMTKCPPFKDVGRPERAFIQALVRTLVFACAAAMTACATVESPSAAPPKPAPEVVSLDEWMSRGEGALTTDDHDKARAAWRAAARDYPTAKQPWLKLSEDFFNAGDYGNAVLAAQEVLQRDPHDRVANSVLAVSGLRITAGSLAALREDGVYAVGSRDEAVQVTHALREALGEPVLVPPDPAPPRKRPAHAARPKAPSDGASAAATSTVTAAAPAAAPARTAATAQPAPAGNPLDKLK
jgi:hypothetical protein